MCDDVTAVLIPQPLLPGRKEVDLEVELGNKGGLKGRCSKNWVYFSLPYI